MLLIHHPHLNESLQRLFLCRRVSIFKDLRGKVSCLRIKCAQLERNREELVRYLEQSEDNIAHLKAELSKRDVELQHQQRCRSLGRPGTGWPHRPAGSAADKEDMIEQSELQKRVEGGCTGCHQVGVALGEGRRKRSDVGQKFPFSTFRPAGVSVISGCAISSRSSRIAMPTTFTSRRSTWNTQLSRSS